MSNIRHIAAALALAAVAPSAALAATSVGVSVSVVQPGVYGRIDIGAVPAPPAVYYPRPVVYAPPPPVAVVPAPVYIYAPPGHRKHWGQHCARYDACGVPVYFVRETWVRERYDHHHDHDHH